MTNKLLKTVVYISFIKFDEQTKTKHFMEVFHNLLKKQKKIFSWKFYKIGTPLVKPSTLGL